MIRLTTLIDEVRQEGYNEANANGTYRRQIERSRNANWMGVPVADAMNLIIDFLSGL